MKCLTTCRSKRTEQFIGYICSWSTKIQIDRKNKQPFDFQPSKFSQRRNILGQFLQIGTHPMIQQNHDWRLPSTAWYFIATRPHFNQTGASISQIENKKQK